MVFPKVLSGPSSRIFAFSNLMIDGEAILMRRVAVTGMGIICASGDSVDKFWKNISSGTCSINRMEFTKSSVAIRSEYFGHCNYYDSRHHFPKRGLFQLDRGTEFAVVAARQAVVDSGMKNLKKAAVIIGVGSPGADTQNSFFQNLYEFGHKQPDRFALVKGMPNAPSAQISIEFGIEGLSYSLAAACAASNLSVGMGFNMVRSGMCDTAIVGGTEASLDVGYVKAWEGLGVLSQRPCAPFCKTRRGMSLAEGGAIFVLEHLDSAVSRGANIHAELTGFASNSNATNLLSPSLEAASCVIRSCMKDAGDLLGNINYINTHGTGTIANDKIETEAISSVFGENSKNILLSSTKSMHGHALGASGGIELCATILSLKNGIVPPTVSYEVYDPDCDLDYVVNNPRTMVIDAALSNSFAFGGHNAVISVRRWPAS